MNVAAVVARLVHHYEPFDSAYYDKWDAIKKCSDCVFCQFVRRDNDPDCIDPVQGVVTYEGEQEVERANSIADLKDHRDMREKVPYTRCLLNGKMVHGDPKDLKMNDFTETSMEAMKGVCNQYIWRKTLYKKCLWVPASQSAEFSGKDIIAGTGDLQVIAKRVLKEEVSRVDEAEREFCGSRTTN
jgi:hypothetical protein